MNHLLSLKHISGPATSIPDMRGPIPDLDDQGDLGEQFVPTQIQEQDMVTNEQVLCSFVLF
jgi:hypothetical protein